MQQFGNSRQNTFREEKEVKNDIIHLNDSPSAKESGNEISGVQLANNKTGMYHKKYILL